MSRFLVAASALAFLAVPASAAVVETLETLGPKDVSLPSLLSPIGTFNPIAGGAGNVFISSPGYTNYGAGNNPTTTSILTANGDEAFELLLAGPANSVYLDVYLNDLGPATLTYFDGAVQIGQYILGADANPANNFLSQIGMNFGPGTQITRITFASTLGGRLNTGIDNITVEFLPNGVPEPATWAMLIAGFGVVGGATRTRRRAASAFA